MTRCGHLEHEGAERQVKEPAVHHAAREKLAQEQKVIRGCSAGGCIRSDGRREQTPGRHHELVGDGVVDAAVGLAAEAGRLAETWRWVR